jgi:hypothetical protein
LLAQTDEASKQSKVHAASEQPETITVAENEDASTESWAQNIRPEKKYVEVLNVSTAWEYICGVRIHICRAWWVSWYRRAQTAVFVVPGSNQTHNEVWEKWG